MLALIWVFWFNRSMMIMGFMDESGSSGVANNANDFLVVSLVLFPNKEAADKCSAAIDRLRKRLGLRDTYEFHFSRNAPRYKEAFVKLLPNVDFQFITVAIKKDATHRLASYSRVANLLIHEIVRHTKDARILLDSNPVLCERLKKLAKSEKLHGLKFGQAKSHVDNLLQMADYVAALSSKRAKGAEKSIGSYRSIAKKQLAFLEISA